MQFELRFFPASSVRGVLKDYAAMKADGISEETRDEDYRYREAWLIEVLGELTPAASVTFTILEQAARAARGVLRDVTIKRRLRYWRAAMKYAAQRGIVPRDSVPELPPWLKEDGVRCEDYYTLPQFGAFRMALAPGRFRRYADLGMWTAQHTHDIVSMQRWMLEPGFEWVSDDGEALHVGRWWRRNHKNRRCVAAWVPMEPELRTVAQELLTEPGAPGGLLVGGLNNLRRTFHTAAARAELPPIRPNLGLRASHATLLLTRWESYEYVRLVLGHEGEVSTEKTLDGAMRAKTAKRPSTLSRHYLRSGASVFTGRMPKK